VVEIQAVQTDRNAAVDKPKRYAVVVGVNDYTEAGIGNLSFCAADAEAFYDALITYCEYDPECVVLFSDSTREKAKKPKRSDILATISKMSSCATEDDSILFFFAGHLVFCRELFGQACLSAKHRNLRAIVALANRRAILASGSAQLIEHIPPIGHKTAILLTYCILFQ